MLKRTKQSLLFYFKLFLIVVLISIVIKLFLPTFEYMQNKDGTNKNTVENTCPKGCTKPNGPFGNCTSVIRNEQEEYVCPWECTDTSSGCKYDIDCKTCKPDIVFNKNEYNKYKLSILAEKNKVTGVNDEDKNKSKSASVEGEKQKELNHKKSGQTYRDIPKPYEDTLQL